MSVLISLTGYHMYRCEMRLGISLEINSANVLRLLLPAKLLWVR